MLCQQPQLATASFASGLTDEIVRLGVAAKWAAHMAAKGSILPLRVENVRGKAAGVLKQQMLALGGECAVGRQVANFDDTPGPSHSPGHTSAV